ncbi:sensor histidine kinase [Embleya sp. NPDC127516]|uniref:sensor histidine kinase n=1 Tax=Embleya sp. NPDC127516 TaxID=3363990 RepID=UPI0037FE68EF
MIDAGARWIRAFHLLFFACLGISSAAAFAHGGSDWTTLGLAVFMGGWYAVCVARRPHLLERLNPMGWHLLVLIALLIVLIRRDPAYEMLVYGMFSLPYLLLPTRWGYLGAALLVVTATAAVAPLSEVLRDPVSFGPAVGSVGLVIVMGLFANHLVRQGERSRSIGVLEERARLAREIHDTLAQGFSGIVAQLEAAEQNIDDPVVLRRRVALAKGLARDSLVEARRSVEALRPEPLEGASLHGALVSVAARWSAETGVPAEVTIDGVPRRLGADVEATVLRAAQESLANVARHAGAKRVALTLSYMDGEVTLDVLDDGAGFVPSAARAGYGLAAMRERAAHAGGRVTVESAPGEGTAVCLSIPCG